MVLSPKKMMMSSDRLLITSCDARKRSVAGAQLVRFGEAALTRPIQARVAERQLGCVKTDGRTTRCTGNTRAVAVGAPPPARLAITRISHGSPHERWQTRPVFGVK